MTWTMLECPLLHSLLTARSSFLISSCVTRKNSRIIFRANNLNWPTENEKGEMLPLRLQYSASLVSTFRSWDRLYVLLHTLLFRLGIDVKCLFHLHAQPGAPQPFLCRLC